MSSRTPRDARRLVGVIRTIIRRPRMRRRPDYSEKPTIVVAVAEHGEVIGAHAEGFDLPRDVRLVIRDFSAGEIEDEDGFLYEDREVLPGEEYVGGRVTTD